MNLWWIFGITIFVLLEKVAPLGRQAVAASGVLLLIAAVWFVLRP